MTPDAAAFWQTIAASVQAAASILALAIAIYVPYRIAKNARVDLAEQKFIIERSLAITLQRSYMRMACSIDAKQRLLAEKTEEVLRSQLLVNRDDVRLTLTIN